MVPYMQTGSFAAFKGSNNPIRCGHIPLLTEGYKGT